MMILTLCILGGILLAALSLGGVGMLCTQDRRDRIPGLLFGLPTVVLSLLVYVFFIEAQLFWGGIVAVPSLAIGALVLWRGFRTGQKRGDFLSAGIVCAVVFLLGFVLVRYPEITRAIFVHLLPPAPVL